MVSRQALEAYRADGRAGLPVPAGLLYYSQLDSMLRVEARPNEIRALIIARNELAAFLSKKRSLATSATPTPSDSVGDIEDAAFLPPTIITRANVELVMHLTCVCCIERSVRWPSAGWYIR